VGGAPKQLYPGYHPHLATHHLDKFHKATFPGSKDLAAGMLNFKPIYDHFEKTVKGTPVHFVVCASKTWSFSSGCEKLGRSTS